LLFLATVLQVITTIEYFEWYNILDTVLASIASTATISGLYISRVFVRHGPAGLQNVKLVWWLLSLMGVLLVVAAGISKLLPPAPPYSVEETIRYDLELFLFGLPIVIPLLHLFSVRFIRRSDEGSVSSAQRNLS
jgi:hypothetical protein